MIAQQHVRSTATSTVLYHLPRPPRGKILESFKEAGGAPLQLQLYIWYRVQYASPNGHRMNLGWIPISQHLQYTLHKSSVPDLFLEYDVMSRYHPLQYSTVIQYMRTEWILEVEAPILTVLQSIPSIFVKRLKGQRVVLFRFIFLAGLGFESPVPVAYQEPPASLEQVRQFLVREKSSNAPHVLQQVNDMK